MLTLPIVVIKGLCPSNLVAAGRPGVFPDENITVNGKTREYRLVVPDSVNLSKPAPLVFAYHGLTDSKDRMPLYTHLDDLAKKEGFILVYPNGINRKWNIALRRNEDLDFFDTLYAHLKASHDVDPGRVFATGMSNGAYFVHLLASQRSNVLAAIAAHSGGLGVLAIRGINAKRKYPVLVIHGDADPIVPVEVGRRARDAYKKEDHEVEYVEVHGLGHMWATKANINDRIWQFFKAHPLQE